MSLVPSIADTFTPTVTIEDSRGQTQVVTLSNITVNSYNSPSASINTYRVNSTSPYIKDDEGTYGIVAANITYTHAVANLIAPTVTVVDNDGNSISKTVTWYLSWNATTGASTPITNWSTLTPSSSGNITVYGLIQPDNGFSVSKSYVVTLYANDSRGGVSAGVTSTLSIAYYTIDVQAGGKEITFGTAAKDSLTNYPNGLRKSAMTEGLVLNVDGNASSSTDAISGEDMALFNAIRSAGWYSNVIELDNMLNVKKLLALIINSL